MISPISSAAQSTFNFEKFLRPSLERHLGKAAQLAAVQLVDALLTQQFDRPDADEVPSAKFNRVLWTGMKGSKQSYPALRGQIVSQQDKDD